MANPTAPFDAATERILPSSRVCRVHLFRHAEVVGAGERLCRGQIDVPLSARGEQQTLATATRWRGPYDRVYTSDLQRCAALAHQLQGASPLVSTPRLREQNMGDWEGVSWAELTQRDPTGTSAYWDDYVNARPPGGESFGALSDRVTAWWSDEQPEGNIAIVTHIGCIRALVCSWLGLGAHEGLRFAPDYASHSECLLADAGVVIVKFGETAS